MATKAKWKGGNGEWLLGSLDRGAAAGIVKDHGDDYGVTSYWFGHITAHRDLRDVTLASAKMTGENMRRMAEMAFGDEPSGGKKRHAKTRVGIRAVANAMNKTREPWSPSPKTAPWFLSPGVTRILDAGAKLGWVRRPSTSQVEWTEKGVELARQDMQKSKPSKKWRRSTDNPAVGRDVLRRAYGGKKRHGAPKRRPNLIAEVRALLK